jgi:hypothetical protein
MKSSTQGNNPIQREKIDIENANDFEEAGFRFCETCGWSIDAGHFADHDCSENDLSNKKYVKGMGWLIK